MNPYLNASIYFLTTTVFVLISILLFDLITKYKIWPEITKGNVAVSLSTGGIVVGVAIIMHGAITANDTLLQTIIWGGAGTILLLIVYLGFELLTPKLNVSEEIGKGNVAVGLLSCFFSIAFSLVIAASLS